MRLTRSRRAVAFIFLAVALCIAGQAAVAASIEVSVLGLPDETPLTGIEVRLENQGLGLAQTAKTNALGKARFQGLAAGPGYVLTVPASSAWSERVAEAIDLRTNGDRTLTLLLAPKAALVESVTVRDEGVARINTINAEVSSTVTRGMIETTPVEGRDLTRILYRLPNVTQATGLYPEAPNVSINGANSLFSNYMIDGLDNNENFLGGQKFAMPAGFSQDVSVLTNNYSGEFGRTANGIFNVTSRSGSNEFGGEVFSLMRPGPSLDANASSAQRDLSGNAVKTGFARNQGGVAVGGPIVKNTTFFFVDAEYTRDDKDNLLTSPALGVNESVPGTNTFGYYSFKIDHRWTSEWQSSLRVSAGDVTIERQGGGLDGGVSFPSAANSQDRDSVIAAWTNRWTAGRVVAETNLQFSRFRWDYGRPESGVGPQSVVLDPTGQTAAILGHPGYVFDDLEKSWQLQQKFEVPAGRHLFRAGAEVISSGFALLGGGNVDGNYTVMLTPAEMAAVKALNKGADLDVEDIPDTAQVLDYNVELRTKTFGKRQTITSLYGEDVWSATSDLDLTLSLRYDYDNLSEGGADSGDTDNIAPRLAANWQIGPRTAVRAGAGLFYDKILYAITSDALQQNSNSNGFRSQLRSLIDKGILPKDTDLGRVLYPGNISADFSSGITYLQGPKPEDVQGERENIVSNERRILNPDGYDNPYTVQYAAGWQQQLAPACLLYADVVRNLSYNLLRLRDLNAPDPYPIDPDNVVVRTQAQADASRPVAIVPGGARNIVVSETEGQARYWAANVTFLKERSASSVSWQLSYTVSRLTNNTDDINFRAQDANDFDDEWGPSLNDRRQVLAGVFAWYPLDGLTFSIAPLIQSGQPVNRIPDASIYGTTDLNGDGRSFGDAYVGNSDRSPGEKRNSDRLPWSETVDLGAAYRFRLHGRQILEIRADIFNLFNTVNLSGYSNNATQSNQIQIGPPGYGITQKNSGPPRQFQFGIRYAF